MPSSRSWRPTRPPRWTSPTSPRGRAPPSTTCDGCSRRWPGCRSRSTSGGAGCRWPPRISSARRDDLLTVAVRYGYGSTEAFGRAFRAVHGVGPGDVRRDGGPLRTQPRIRFHLTVEGSVPMDTRITNLPAVRLVGHATRVPLIHDGVNPHIAEHVAADPGRGDRAAQEPERHRALGGARRQRRPRPGPRRGQRAHLPARRGDHRRPACGARRDRGAGRHLGGVPDRGPHPAALQEAWAATATTWFPSQPWRLRPGPEIVAMLAFDAEAGTATCELWLPVEPAGSGARSHG